MAKTKVKKPVAKVEKRPIALKESTANTLSLFGQPFDYNQDPWDSRWLGAGAQFDYWPDRPVSIFNTVQLTLARVQSKYLVESNPNAAGIVLGLQNYTCGSGSNLDFSAVDETQPPEQLVKRLTQYLNYIKRWNKFKLLERDLVAAYHRDGEIFLELEPFWDEAEDKFCVRIKQIPPIYIMPPMGEDHMGPWSFGIYTPDDDAQHPEAYCVHDIRNWVPSGGRDRIVPATRMVHIKNVLSQQQKRGTPSFYAPGQELLGATRLRYATRESEIVRACIAYIIQGNEQSGAEELRTLQQSLITDPAQVVNSLSTSRTMDFANKQPGQEVLITHGMEYKEPPEGPFRAKNSGLGVQQALDAVACRFNIPPWLAGSPSNDTSYAQSLTVESPFVKSIESVHVVFAEAENDLFTHCVNLAVVGGYLPPYILRNVELNTVFPSPLVRNGKDETERRKILNAAGILSDYTWAAEEGYDYDQEVSHGAKKEELATNIDGKSEPQTMGGERQRDEGPRPE